MSSFVKIFPNSEDPDFIDLGRLWVKNSRFSDWTYSVEGVFYSHGKYFYG